MHETRLIRLVADDFGSNASANEAILHAHQHGALTSAALMMGQPGTPEAIQIAEASPHLEIGLHFHFCDSIPLTVPHWPWGPSPSSLGLRIGFQSGSTNLILSEIESQWKAFLETGFIPAFVNVHHHLHAHPWIAYRLIRFLRSHHFQGWIRCGSPRFFSDANRWKSLPLNPWAHLYRRAFGLHSPQTLWGIDRLFQMNPQEVQRAIGSLTDGFHELIFHPRHLTDVDTTCLIQLKAIGLTP